MTPLNLILHPHNSTTPGFTDPAQEVKRAKELVLRAMKDERKLHSHLSSPQGSQPLDLRAWGEVTILKEGTSPTNLVLPCQAIKVEVISIHDEDPPGIDTQEEPMTNQSNPSPNIEDDPPHNPELGREPHHPSLPTTDQESTESDPIPLVENASGIYFITSGIYFITSGIYLATEGNTDQEENPVSEEEGPEEGNGGSAWLFPSGDSHEGLGPGDSVSQSLLYDTRSAVAAPAVVETGGFPVEDLLGDSDDREEETSDPEEDEAPKDKRLLHTYSRHHKSSPLQAPRTRVLAPLVLNTNGTFSPQAVPHSNNKPAGPVARVVPTSVSNPPPRAPSIIHIDSEGEGGEGMNSERGPTRRRRSRSPSILVLEEIQIHGRGPAVPRHSRRGPTRIPRAYPAPPRREAPARPAERPRNNNYEKKTIRSGEPDASRQRGWQGRRPDTTPQPGGSSRAEVQQPARAGFQGPSQRLMNLNVFCERRRGNYR